MAVNVIVSIPALSLICLSAQTREFLYERIVAPKVGRLKVAFIGDSLTAGGGVWAWKLGRYDFDTRNFGRGGFTIRQMQFSTEDVIRNGAKYAFVMAGRNDEDKSDEGAERSFADYRKYILDPLLSAGVQPVIQLTLYRENDDSPAFVRILNKRLVEFAKDRGIRVIDLNPLLCQGESLLPKFSKDGVHVNDAAYEIWAEEVRRTVLELRI